MDNPSLNADVLTDSENVTNTFPGRCCCLSILLLFYIFLFYGSLTPFIFKSVHIGWNEGISQILATGGHIESQMDWYVNLFLGIPAGFFMLGVLCLDRKAFWSAICALPVVFVCFLMAFIVERLQLYTVNRNCALSDILAQTCGAGVGCIIWAISGQALWDELRRFWNGSGNKGAVFVLVFLYFFALIIDAWSPFDVVYSLGDIWERWKNLILVWNPLGDFHFGSALYVISKLLLFFFLYIPIGIYIQWKSSSLKLQSDSLDNCFMRILRDHPLVFTIVFTFVISTIAFVGQFFIQSKILNISYVFIAVLAAVVGWIVSRPYSSRNRLLIAIASLIAILVAMVGYYWTPFNFSVDAFKNDNVFTVYQLIPLADYQRSHTITAINRLLSSLEFSIVITLSLRQILANVKYGSWFTLSICAFIFILMEGGQLFLPTRTFTFSDIILQTLFSVGTLKILSFFENMPVISNKQDK